MISVVVVVNVALLLVAVLAVLIFVDAERLRRDVNASTGPAGQSALAWALGSLLLAVIVIPLYLVKRERFQGREKLSVAAQIARAWLFVISLFAGVTVLMLLVGLWLASRPAEKHSAVAIDASATERIERLRDAQIDARHRQRAAEAAEAARRTALERAEHERQEAAYQAELDAIEAEAEARERAIELRARAQREEARLANLRQSCKESAAWRKQYGSVLLSVASNLHRATCDELRSQPAELRKTNPPAGAGEIARRLATLMDEMAEGCLTAAQAKRVFVNKDAEGLRSVAFRNRALEISRDYAEFEADCARLGI